MTTIHAPRSAHELEDLLRARRGRVRLCGSGSQQERVPPAGSADVVQLRHLDAIHRLEPGDLTCSVGAGLRREVLDDALRAVGLELPCAGGGTIGGLFAHDPVGAGTAPGTAPQALLLGLDGMLACGTRFRSGAQVVKSVAGFDVHKLLVGSNGRLFVAVQLHLRLRPRPRAEAWFGSEGLDAATACARFVQLRSLAEPPADLWLRRTAAGCAVAGRFTGRARFVAERLRCLSLPEAPRETQQPLHLDPAPGGEVLAGIVLPSRVPALLAAIPAVPFVLRGSGRFELASASPAHSDLVFAELARHGAQATIVRGEPVRRGTGTPLDPGTQRLLTGLKRALDPDAALV